MKKIVIILISIFISGYLLLCIFMYLFQEKFIFKSRKLAQDYEFQIDSEFEEIYFKMDDGTELHGLLCKADSAKGLFFYLHGSGGSIKWYEEIVPHYISLDYDIFLIDYRGYGKSNGKITREKQLLDDAKRVYEILKTRYDENNIIIVSNSMGTYIASMLAANYNPKALIIQGSPVSMLNSGKRKLPILPLSLIARYKLDIRQYLPEIKVPIIIFHGKIDDRASLENALKMKPFIKSTDRFIILEGEGHNDFAHNDQYVKVLRDIIDN